MVKFLKAVETQRLSSELLQTLHREWVGWRWGGVREQRNGNNATDKQEERRRDKEAENGNKA